MITTVAEARCAEATLTEVLDELIRMIAADHDMNEALRDCPHIGEGDESPVILYDPDLVAQMEARRAAGLKALRDSGLLARPGTCTAGQPVLPITAR